MICKNSVSSKAAVLFASAVTLIFTGCSSSSDNGAPNNSDAWTIISTSEGEDNKDTIIVVSPSSEDTLKIVIDSGVSTGDTITAFNVSTGDSIKVLYNDGTLTPLADDAFSSTSSSGISISSSSKALSSSSSIDRSIYLNPAISYGEFIDPRDHKTYKTVVIGDQTWMAQNLDYETDSSWCGGTSCEYGRMYRWAGAVDIDAKSLSSFSSITCQAISTKNHQGVCPKGWHIPNDLEWLKLANFVKTEQGADFAKTLKSINAWPTENEDLQGTDDYGFSVLPGGYMYKTNYIGYKNYDNTETAFWSSIPDDGDAVAFTFDSSNTAELVSLYRTGADYVRCLQNSDSEKNAVHAPYAGSVYDSAANTLTDLRDNKVYKTTIIGTQIWMAENLNYLTEGGYADEYAQSRCPHDNQMNCDKYGRFYTWTAAMDIPSDYQSEIFPDSIRHQGICPSGWHLPSMAEYDTLNEFVGGTVAGYLLKSTDTWLYDSPTVQEYAFNVLAAGYYSSCEAESFGYNASFWTSSQKNATSGMHFYFSDAYSQQDGFYEDSKYSFLSIRCISDKRGAEKAFSAYDSIKDPRDNRIYKTAKIGNQTWMAENLNYADSIQNPTLTANSWCYNDSAKNCEQYGRIYSWTAAMDLDTSYQNLDATSSVLSHQGICPDGWHIPTRIEWDSLETYIGGSATAGKFLKATEGWENNGNGMMNKYGFSALPAGMLFNSFLDVGYRTDFWTSTELDETRAYIKEMTYDKDSMVSFVSLKPYGRSIRCIKDE